MSEEQLRVLAVVPSAYCFGLQNLTLAFFGNAPPWLRSRFLNTRWTDGEFGRRLDALGIPHSSTWLGMFSRKTDLANLKMTAECLVKLPIAWWDFAATYRRYRPDIVYFANHHEVILLLPLLVWIRRRVVCHIHDPPPPIGFQRASFALWRRAVGRFLFISASTERRMRSVGPLGPDAAVVHNGIAILPLPLPRRRSDSFCEQFGWPHDSVVVGITGQLTETKGHEDFIEAAILASAGSPSLRFVIGGKAAGGYAGRLQERIAREGRANLFGFSGWLEHPNQFYDAIDVLVLASRHEEGFGLVLAEAGERGVPAIATRSGGAVEIVEDGQTGVLVDRGDVRAMADAMSRLTDPELRSRLGTAARKRVAREFDLEAQAREFAQLLRDTAVQA